MKYFALIIFLFFSLTTQAQTLVLDICDSIPTDLYEQELTSLTVRNGQGYCWSHDKQLDKRIAKLKNLKRLTFTTDYYQRHQFTLPKQICKLKKLESLSTNSIVPQIFGLKGLKKLDLNLSTDSAGIAEQKGFAIFQDLEELTLSFVHIKTEYSLKGIAELPNLKRVVLYGPNQNVIDEVLQNPNITHLSIQQAKGKSFDFAKLKRLTSLTLTFNDLTEIPPSVYGLIMLDTLELMYNKISVVPVAIGKLKSLKYLSLYNNTIHTLASEVGECSNLSWLRLDYNRSLGKLPESIGMLRLLTELRASYCGLQSIPKSIENCQKLEVLDVSNNQLTTLNLNFERLPHVKTLAIVHNKLTDIPASLYTLDSLKKLDLSDNELVELPEGIEQMEQLISLAMNNNKLIHIPSGIADLANLTYLSAYNNDLLGFVYVAKLTQLETLYIGDNSMLTYPKGIANLKALTSLEIQQNRFTTFPSFVYELPLLDRVWIDEYLKTKKGYLPERKQPILLWQ